MKELTSHAVNGCNDALNVAALDDPGHGGAHHKYLISAPANPGKNDGVYLELAFQNGPIKEVGTNGITHEALLAVLIDRLEGFQSGDYACKENQFALDYLRDAQEALKSRTKERLTRGVEGTHAV